MLYYDQGQLKFVGEKQPLLNWVAHYQEPTYVYSGKQMELRAQALIAALPETTEIYYALKANDHKEVLRLFIRLGLGMDVVSLGELQWSLEQGCPPHKIIFSGVGKTEKELIYAIQVGVRQINVESIPELRRISRLTHQLQTPAAIGLRVNPNVDAQTHPYIATGLKNNKFGIEVEALNECEQIFESNSLMNFKGFSLHIGSQLTDLSVCTEALDKLRPVIDQWKSKGYRFETLDVGGGLGIFYDRFDDQQELALAKEWGERIRKAWGGLSEKILVEPGRWLVAHGGVLLTRVEYIKTTSLHSFAVVDTGMHHLLRPALYQAQHRILPLLEPPTPATMVTSASCEYQVVGPICESSDVVASKVHLLNLKEGDFLAVLDVGAYGHVMSSHYNRRPPAQEIYLG